ncbi:hypothetical protein [Sphingomonas sp. BK580]|uniref:hypothetical protein n=1 Tax=Sphingomonas sp. BK580 TaxID=2586972 RepID=UPI001621BA47|nr:hypothetical protein [Sphingomonas sp. BK580]MBB3692993.1 DNA-binding MarR family transcriptional regulator [Sphingomonas sp. BK580]
MAREANASLGLKKMDRALTAWRQATSGATPVQLFHTFVLVCLNEGIGVQALADKAGASKGTMSRHLLDLSSTLRNGEEGYGLLSRIQDPTSLRNVQYVLTNKGKLLKNQIEDALE